MRLELLLTSTLLFVACSVPETQGTHDFVDLLPEGIPERSPGEATILRNSPVEGQSVEGRPLTARVIGNSGPCLLLLGAIHGDEPGSHELVRDFERWILDHPIESKGLQLVISSPLNPDGLQRGTRANARGIDLNRNFPSKNFRASRRRGHEPLCEPESRFLARLLETYRPALVITVHQPRRSVNWDGPAEDLARAMARLNGYRPEATVGYSTPGSLGSWVGIDQGIPILTLELPRNPGPKATFLQENLSALILAMAAVRRGGRRAISPKQASTPVGPTQ